jgi:hypothetical protein
MQQSEKASEDTRSELPACKAEFIFYAQPRSTNTRPVKVLDEYACDFRRPDWEHRWMEWNARQNPYLHLFLCGDHAKKLGLIK